MKAEDFAEWLAIQVPKFDQEVLETIRPIDGWICCGSYDEWLENRYQRTLIAVRFISENAVNSLPKDNPPPLQEGYIATVTMPFGTPTELSQDRFRKVWAKTTKPWRKNQ